MSRFRGFCFLVVFSMVLLVSCKRTNLYSPTIQGDFRAFLTDDNITAQVVEELNSEACQEAMEQSLGVARKKTAFRLEDKFFLLISIETDLRRESAKKKIHGWAEQYFRLRSQGHSQAYSLASLRHTYSNPPAALKGSMALISREDPTIPPEWLKPVKDYELDAPFRGETFAVIDNGMAWIYVVDPTVTSSGWQVYEERVDAQEIDPKTKSAIDAASKEAWTIYRQEYPKRQLGDIHGYWTLKEKILWDRYGIEWRSPAALNPLNSYD